MKIIERIMQRIRKVCTSHMSNQSYMDEQIERILCHELKWRDVEEEPVEHGKSVLAYYINDYGKKRIIKARYVGKFEKENYSNEYLDADYDKETDNYYCPEGWYEDIDNWGDFNSVMVSEGVITYWMPLPEFPDTEEV